MPHQCTNCGQSFADGSKQMLAGCPECGGNKFQFLPEEVGGEGVDGPDRTESPTATADSRSADSDADIIEAPAEPVDSDRKDVDFEDRAQASARRSIVSQDELPPAEAHYGAEQPPAPVEEPETADLTELRQELNQQFESIKILRPGEYELNLMELYDREEYIIALEEDGRYVIEVPDTWRESQ